MSTDEAKKQYFILSAIAAFVISLILNFTILGKIDGPFFSGFPINVVDAGGTAGFFERIVNSITLGALLIVPMYYFILWLLRKSNSI